MAYSVHIEIHLFFERVEALNEMLAYSPTRKDKKGAWEYTPRGNIPFTFDELMKLAIECFLPLGLWGHLIREKGDNYYPVSYASFIEDLKHVTEGYK